jgi:hypothetical protein
VGGHATSRSRTSSLQPCTLPLQVMARGSRGIRLVYELSVAYHQGTRLVTYYHWQVTSRGHAPATGWSISHATSRLFCTSDALSPVGIQRWREGVAAGRSWRREGWRWLLGVDDDIVSYYKKVPQYINHRQRAVQRTQKKIIKLQRS